MHRGPACQNRHKSTTQACMTSILNLSTQPAAPRYRCHLKFMHSRGIYVKTMTSCLVLQRILRVACATNSTPACAQAYFNSERAHAPRPMHSRTYWAGSMRCQIDMNKHHLSVHRAWLCNSTCTPPQSTCNFLACSFSSQHDSEPTRLP